MNKSRMTNINDEDLAGLMVLQKAVEKTAAKLIETKAVHKAAKAAHEEAQQSLGKYLYALHHGLPLFDGPEQAEEDQ
jgi:tyrosine-protein phosphatase YwqE